MTTECNVDMGKLKDLFDRGLCGGLGDARGQVCVEGAISLACGLGLGDSPPCVSEALRRFSIRLNDSGWSSEEARADGMWELALAQIGTAGKLNDRQFAARLAELTIRRVLPIALRAAKLEDAAKRCEEEGTLQSARAARKATYAAYAAAAAYAADAAAAYAAYAAGADAAARDGVLRLSAAIAVEAIREQIPGAGK